MKINKEKFDECIEKLNQALKMAPVSRVCSAKLFQILGITEAKPTLSNSATVMESFLKEHSHDLNNAEEIANRAACWLVPEGRPAKLYYLVQYLREGRRSLKEMSDEFCLETSMTGELINYRGAYRLLDSIQNELGLKVLKDNYGRRYLEAE